MTKELKRWYVDTETCGLAGPLVLIQYAIEDSAITLHEAWREPVGKTKALIEAMVQEEVAAFNVGFDSFHIQKFYNMIEKLPDDLIPEDIIEVLAKYEHKARDGSCLRPRSVLDLMLVGRKGEMQKTMERKNVVIRRIPRQLCLQLIEILEDRIEFDKLLFARRKKQLDSNWVVEDIVGEPDLVNIILKYRPSGSLKDICLSLGLIDTADKFQDIELDKCYRPEEDTFAPFWQDGQKGQWDEVIRQHISHWQFNSKAREYAAKDILLLQRLDKHYDYPEGNSDDDVLAWQTGVCQWKGYKIDTDKLKALKDTLVVGVATDPRKAWAMIEPHLSKEEIDLIFPDGKISTAKEVIEALAEWEDHPVAAVAKSIIDARRAEKRINLIDKLLKAGRLHAGFNVIGALSGRMSGSGGINAQGIPHEKAFRKCFPLAWDNMKLSGGDFEAFEVTILDATYPDKKLSALLKSGIKIHTAMAEQFFPEMTRQEIVASKGTDNDIYLKGKMGVFAVTFLATADTIAKNAGIPVELAQKGIDGFRYEYCEMTIQQNAYIGRYTAMAQHGGIGTAVTWRDPMPYAETLLGFRRSFELEWRVAKELYNLANKLPLAWRKTPVRVKRRDKLQTPGGATASALYGAAFTIQGQVQRAANNHRIQGTGAQITKKAQREIWDLQPVGVHPWRVMPINIHDELMTPNTCPEEVAKVVGAVISDYRKVVPLLDINWHKEMKSWEEK